MTVTSAMSRATTFAVRTMTVLRSAREPSPVPAAGLAAATSASDNSLNRIPLECWATYGRTHEDPQWDTADREISPRQLPRCGPQLGEPAGRVRVLLLHRRLSRPDH